MKITVTIIARIKRTAITADAAIPAIVLPLRLESAAATGTGSSVRQNISITIKVSFRVLQMQILQTSLWGENIKPVHIQYVMKYNHSILLMAITSVNEAESL